jgi:hypothetical protein
MRLSATALCALFALACGSGNRAKPGVTPGGDAAPPTPEASPDLGAGAAPAPPDAAVETRPDTGAVTPPLNIHDDGGRGEAPPPLVITVAGECGGPSAPPCPFTYKGTSTIPLPSNMGITSAMAPDEALYLGGAFDMPMDFDPTAGVDMRTPQSEDAFLTSLTAEGGYGFTDTFPVQDAFHGAGIYNLAVGTSAVVALGGFDGMIDLDPRPTSDVTYQSLGGRSASFVARMTRAGALLWSQVLMETDGSLVGWSRAALAADGSVYLSGSFAQSTQDGVVLDPVDLDPGPATRTTPNERGSFFMRLDPAGNTKWIRLFGGTGCDFSETTGLVVTPNGSGVFVGTYQGSCSLDQGGPGAFGTPNGMFVLSLTPDGKVLGFGDLAGDLAPASVALASDGTVVIGGAASPPQSGSAAIDFDPSSAMTKLPVPTAGGTFLMAVDAGVKLAWAQVLPDMNFVALAPLSDKGLLLLGEPDATSPQMVVVRLGPDRRETWRFGVGSLSVGPSAIYAGAKGFTIVGSTYQGGGDFDPSAGVDRVAPGQLFLSRFAF